MSVCVCVPTVSYNGKDPSGHHTLQSERCRQPRAAGGSRGGAGLAALLTSGRSRLPAELFGVVAVSNVAALQAAWPSPALCTHAHTRALARSHARMFARSHTHTHTAPWEARTPDLEVNSLAL